MAKRFGNNRHNVTWGYAQACWQALVSGQDVPPIPEFMKWEVNESGGGRTVIGYEPIEPMMVSCNGKVVYEQ